MIKNPVLKYYGSKFSLAKWIIEHFPAHRHYVEPFGGAANVLLIKEPSLLETYNDLNDKIFNFFQVLRDRPEELIEKIKITPWSRREYQLCIEDEVVDNPIEKARRLFFHLWMSYQSSMRVSKGNWRRHKNAKRSVLSDIRFENLRAASKRLTEVQVENRDALKLIQEFDSPATLFYLDPPYIASTRVAKKSYTHEMSDEQHKEFAEILYKLQGFVILSGYPSQAYADLFEAKGWHRVDKQARVMGGGKKTECLWLSPRTFETLNK